MAFLESCNSKHLYSIFKSQVEQPLLTESHIMPQGHQADFDLALVYPELLQATHLAVHQPQFQADSLMHLADLSMDIQEQDLHEVPAHS